MQRLLAVIETLVDGDATHGTMHSWLINVSARLAEMDLIRLTSYAHRTDSWCAIWMARWYGIRQLLLTSPIGSGMLTLSTMWNRNYLADSSMIAQLPKHMRSYIGALPWQMLAKQCWTLHASMTSVLAYKC